VNLDAPEPWLNFAGVLDFAVSGSSIDINTTAVDVGLQWNRLQAEVCHCRGRAAPYCLPYC